MLAKFIQEQRKKRSLTQEFLASALKISRPTYMQIEQGERDLTITEAKKLAEVFDIPFKNLLEGKENTKTIVKIEGKKKQKQEAEDEIRISVPQEKVDKFRQVLLYILKKVGGKPNVGMTVLYKLLYFIDFDYYEKYEDQLMGLVYLKNINNRSVFPIPDFCNETILVCKIKKFACRSLKGRGVMSGIRVIYAYHVAASKVEFIEIYFKGEKENEDRERIKEYLKNQNPTHHLI